VTRQESDGKSSGELLIGSEVNDPYSVVCRNVPNLENVIGQLSKQK